MTDIEQQYIQRAVEFTKDLLARRDREALRYDDPDPYFEEDGIVDVVATSTSPHTCVYEEVTMCRHCGAQPRYRPSVRVHVAGELL